MKKELILAMAAVICAGSASASAANDTEVSAKDTTKVIDIEEIVIIATPKENNRLRQQPLSSASFSQNDMRNNAVTSVKALTGLVPNLFIPEYGSKLTTSIYVRGIGSRINTPAVGLYVDNIPFIEKSAFDFNYSDIERIDVLRGPQGTLYGRNTMGGLIRVFTKSPFSYQGTDVRLSAATYNNYQASLTHYHRISPKFAFSAGFFYGHKGGFFKNDFTGKRIDTDNEFGGRIRAIYIPRENTKLDFTVNYEYTDQGGYPYAYVGAVGTEEDRENYIGKISYDQECGYKRSLLNGGLNIEHQEDDFILSSVTGFQYLNDRMNLDQDFTEQNIYTLRQKQNSKAISQELVFKATPEKRWQWINGISGFYQWLKTDAPVTFHENGVDWLNQTINSNANKYLPSISAGGYTMNFLFNDEITDTTLPVDGNFRTPVLNLSFFHQSTLNELFGIDGLSATIGLRLDYEKLKIKYNSGYTFSHAYSLFGQLTPGDRTIPLVPEGTYEASNRYLGTADHDYLQLLPKFALQYSFNKRNNIYASVTKGYRSGGFNIQMFSDLLRSDMQTAMMVDVAAATLPKLDMPMIPEDAKNTVTQILNTLATVSTPDIKNTILYKPEYAWNYEIGTHLTLFDGKLQTDASLFFMDTRNQQISRFASSGLGRVTVNAGKSKSFGGEVSLRAQITDNFSINGNYGYTYATFTDYVTQERTATKEEINYNGNYIPFVPKHTFNAGAQYIFRLHSHLLDNIAINAGYKAAGRIYWTEDNRASQAFYGLLNGRIALNKGNGQVAFWINNALNRKYHAFYFETMNRGFAQNGNPLQIGVDVRCRF